MEPILDINDSKDFEKRFKKRIINLGQRTDELLYKRSDGTYCKTKEQGLC